MLKSIGRCAHLLPQNRRFKAVILSENRPEWIYALYAVWHARGIPVIFDHTIGDDEIRNILQAARPDVIFCSRQYAAAVQTALPHLDIDPALHMFEEIPETDDGQELTGVTWDEIDDTALIVYTSGTTGAQKGARLSFRNLLSNLEPIMEFATPQDSTLLLLPLYHIFPLLWTVIAPMYAGICTVIAPSLEPEDLLATLRQYPVTAVVGVPALFERIHTGILDRVQAGVTGRLMFKLAGAINSFALSRFIFRRVHLQFGGRLRYLICGGAALDVTIQKNFNTLGFPIYTGYGLTETSPMVSFNKPGDVRLGSVGRPIPKTDIRIVDGEILVRGENVMQGYDGQPEETHRVLEDDWLHTGDLGHLDDDGYLYVTGRKKEIIVLPNGKNINPEDVERRLAAFTAHVEEAAVYEQHGKLAALIVPRPSAGGEAAALHDAIKADVINAYNSTVPSYRKIFLFTVSGDPLPRTSLGKLKRHLIPAMAEERRRPRGGTPDHSSRETSPLLRYIQKEMKRHAKYDDHFVLDLGMDSLDLVVLRAHIESNYTITLTADDVMQHQTVGSLSEFLQHHIDARRSGEQEWRRMFDGTEETALPRTWWTIHLWQGLLRLAYRNLLRVTIEGKDALPPAPVIFAANHQSTLDPFLVTSFLPNSRFRTTWYLAKGSHFRAAWKRWIVDRHNVVIMEPSDDGSPALRTLARCLEQNGNILIFPEGTRSPDGSVTEFKRAFALLSCALSVPVVPVIIAGTGDALPKGKFLPKFGSVVSVRFLDAVDPDGHTPASLTSEIQSLIQAEAAGQSSLLHTVSGK